jgi:hypothetical protein
MKIAQYENNAIHNFCVEILLYYNIRVSKRPNRPQKLECKCMKVLMNISYAE